jgi:hypothetical protein
VADAGAETESATSGISGGSDRGDIEIQIDAPMRSKADVETFTTDTRFVAEAYARLAARLELPNPRVRALLADDLVEAVTRWMPVRSQAEEGESFATVRAGGVVAAKNLDQAGDMSDVPACPFAESAAPDR